MADETVLAGEGMEPKSAPNMEAPKAEAPRAKTPGVIEEGDPNYALLLKVWAEAGRPHEIAVKGETFTVVDDPPRFVLSGPKKSGESMYGSLSTGRR